MFLINVQDGGDSDEDTPDGTPADALVKKTCAPVENSKCCLDLRTQIMIKLIFSQDMFNNQMTEMNLGLFSSSYFFEELIYFIILRSPGKILLLHLFCRYSKDASWEAEQGANCQGFGCSH